MWRSQGTRRAGLIPSGFLPQRASQDEAGWGMATFIGASWKGRLPRKVTQSHPHPTAEETGTQRGRDLPKDTQQSHGWMAQPRLSAWVLPAVCWGPVSQCIPDNSQVDSHWYWRDRGHWTCPQNLPLLADLPIRYKPLVAGAVSPASLESP